MKILVCDDENDRGEAAVNAVQAGAGVDVDVDSLIGDELKKALVTLFGPVRKFFNDPESELPNLSETKFDSADIVIFDNNLAQLEIEGALLTAESVVGYVRAFTKATYIVSLNKNPAVDFDLRYLIGDYETRADLALNVEHLARPDLWSRTSLAEEPVFIPWYWPELTMIHERRKEQIAFVRDRLDASILESLEIPTDAESLGFMSLHAKGCLAPQIQPNETAADPTDEVDIRDMTFLQRFELTSLSIPDGTQRERLAGAARSGDAQATDLIARVVAADIDHWLRRDIIAPQELLVDIPHLLMRMPFLLGTAAGDLAAWNRCLLEPERPHGMDESLYDQSVKPHAFQHTMWIPSPSFWWPHLRQDDELSAEFFKDREVEWADVVFCEDRSAFMHRHLDDGENYPQEFRAEFEGPWTRRHVIKFKGFSYQPGIRFAV